ncbi:MAG: antitoxin [Chloroflexota bacterium]|nr:MAG: antitoxin [Chloroflexota bacterium]
MSTHRMQLLLDEDRHRRLARVARSRGVSMSALVREAIDAISDTDDSRRRAIEAILAAPPIPVPDDPADLRRELDEARGARRFVRDSA